MAKGKVIQYSDIANKSDIDKLKQDLVDIAENIKHYKEELNEVAKVISKNPLKSGKDLKDYNEAINTAVETTNSLNETQQKSIKVSRDYFKSVEALNKQKEKEAQQNEKATRAEREHQAALNKTVKSIEDAKRQNIALRKERDKLDTTTEKGTKALKDLNAKIDDNNKLIKENSDALSQQKIGIGGYKDGIIDAAKETKLFGVSINDASTFLKSGAGVIAGVTAVLVGLGKAYASSARGAEDLARASDRISIITKSLGNSLSDLSGGGNFFDSILRGVQQTLLGVGSTIKSDLQVAILSTIRQLEILEIDQERAKKAQLDRAEQLRQIRDDERNSFIERKAANDALGTVINEREKQTIEYQKEKLKGYQTLLNFDKGNIEIQTAIKQIEFEIADAREEAQGYRSEQQANDLALSKEYYANQLELSNLTIQNEIIRAGETYDLKKKLIENTLALELKAAGDNEQLQNIAYQKAQNDLLIAEQEKTRILTEESEKRIAQMRKEADIEAGIEAESEEILQSYIDNSFDKKAADEEVSNEIINLQNQETENFVANKETQARIDDAVTQTKEANWDTVSNVMSLFQELMGENTEAAKAFAIAATIIDTYRAASASFTKATETYPAPYGTILGAALAAGAIVGGLARVRAITNTKIPKYFEGTEFVELNGNKKGKDTIPAYLNEGERIVPSEINKTLTGISNPELPVLVNLGKMVREKGFNEMVLQQQRTNDLLRRYKYVDNRGNLIDLEGNMIGIG